MTAPTSTTKANQQDRAAEKPSDSATRASERQGTDRPTSAGTEAHELVRTQEEVAQRARRLVAGELVVSASNGDDRHRADRLIEEARAGLLSELREQEQQRARQQLQDAAHSGEEAVAGVVQSVTAIVRTIVPTALVRPEELIEAAYVLADQGLRVSRRLALTVTSGVRSLSTAA
jgi:serine phosphatase RsbU (regulator of sigma subunit)